MVKKNAPKKEKTVASSQSTNKTFLVLESLANADGPMRLQELSNQIQMSQASVLRYLTSLISNEYVYQDEESLRYGITWKIKRLSNNVDSQVNLRSITSPFLNTLAREFNVGASLAREVEFRLVYIDFIDKPGKKLSLRRIGIDAPIHATASGKLLLSKYSNEVIKRFLSQRPLEKMTEHTITDVKEFLVTLDKVRAQEYSTETEECELNNKCISVPLYDFTNTIFGAISVFDVPDNLPVERIQEVLLPRMKEVAKTISIRLGADPSVLSDNK